MLAGEVLSDRVAPWRPITRIVFRFWTSYVALYYYLSFLVPLSVVQLVATRVFGVEMVAEPFSGSGDRMVDWVRAFCLLVIAVVATMIWSALDRKRERYDRLIRVVRFAMRFSLASAMAGYGAAKIVPMQMPEPGLVRLLEPYGQFSPMGVLWSAIGSSPAYESFAGATELLAAILLIIPRTVLAGALVAFAATTYIFVLNMTYDVPVKLYSFHLMLLSVVLIAPDARRLFRAVVSAHVRDRTSGSRLRSLWIVGHAVLALAVIGTVLGTTVRYGPNRRSPLYGVWNVDRLTIDEVERAALVTDAERWRRVVFDQPTMLAFQKMNDTSVFRQVAIDRQQRSITVEKSTTAAGGKLSFERSSEQEMNVTGELDGQRIAMHLVRMPDAAFPLKTRGFHWVQEFPFNR